MKNGKCPRCDSDTVYRRTNGIVSGDKCVYVKGLSFFTSASDQETYICATCGHYENYITDRKTLDQITEKWDKA